MLVCEEVVLFLHPEVIRCCEQSWIVTPPKLLGRPDPEIKEPVVSGSLASVLSQPLNFFFQVPTPANYQATLESFTGRLSSESLVPDLRLEPLGIFRIVWNKVIVLVRRLEIMRGWSDFVKRVREEASAPVSSERSWSILLRTSVEIVLLC